MVHLIFHENTTQKDYVKDFSSTTTCHLTPGLVVMLDPADLKSRTGKVLLYDERAIHFSLKNFVLTLTDISLNNPGESKE